MNFNDFDSKLRYFPITNVGCVGFVWLGVCARVRAWYVRKYHRIINPFPGTHQIQYSMLLYAFDRFKCIAHVLNRIPLDRS